MNCTIYVVKTKALISFEVTTKLIHGFVFAYAKSWFSHYRLIYVLYIQGDEVKSKLISTDNTWAFGWKKAMFGRKSWGFFPTEVVKRTDEGSLKRPLVD